jgi:hypothetical protein
MSLEFKFITRAVSENEKKTTVKIILLLGVVWSPWIQVYNSGKVEESIVMYTFVISLNQSRRNW